MRLIAALLSGIAAALLAGLIAGVSLRLGTRRIRTQTRPRDQWIAQAGLNMTARQFWTGSFLAGVMAFGLLTVMTGVWTVALPPAIVVLLLPRAYFGRLRERRLAEVQRAWPDGLRDLVASISSGMSLQRATGQLAMTGPLPLRTAFARYPFLASTLGFVPALEVIKEELADPTSDRVIEVLILAHQRGGPIVPEILGDLAEATTRDVWMIEEIATQALEQKINARAVFALPWLVLLAITLGDGAFRDFYSTSAGFLVVLIGAGLSGVGIWLVTALGKDPIEPRVLAGSPIGRETA